MAKCKVCDKYVDQFEWPAEHRDEYRPDLCYSCYLAKQQSGADEAEEAENFDHNTDFGMSEVKPDPEDDDAPDLGEDQTEEEMEVTDDDCREDNAVSDDVQRMRDLQRSLFG